jgi:hypothetical protein
MGDYTINYVRVDDPLATIADIVADKMIVLTPLKKASAIMHEMFQVCYDVEREPGPVFMALPDDMTSQWESEIYSALTRIKDGHLYSNRGVYKDWWVDSPQVWVLGREEPNLEMMSKDRWCLRESYER